MLVVGPVLAGEEKPIEPRAVPEDVMEIARAVAPCVPCG